MATYVVTSPEGEEYEVTAPEGATEQEVLEYAKANFTATKPQAPAPQARGTAAEVGRQAGLTARAGVTGTTSLGTMVGDAANTLINAGLRNPSLTPPEIIEKGYQLPMASESVQNLATQAGLPVPETGIEKFAQTGAAAMTGVGLEAALAKAAGSQLLAPLTQQLGAQTTAAGIAAPVAEMVGEQATESFGSNLAGLAVGLAAGVISGNAAAKALRKGDSVFNPGQKPVTIEDVKQEARIGYKQVEDAGITIKPMNVLGFVDKARKELDAANFNPELSEHKDIGILLNGYRKMVGQQRVKFSTIEQMISQATQLANSPSANTRRLAKILSNSLDDSMSNIEPKDVITGQGNVNDAIKTLMNSRKKWKVASRAQVLEDVLDVSAAKALDPKASESELIRRGVIALLANKNKARMFSGTERAAMETVANSGTKDSILSMVARFNPQRSQLAASGTAAGAIYDPFLAAASAGLGFTADKMQQMLRKKATKKLITGMLTGTLEEPMDMAGYRSLQEALKEAQ
tara:strand:- start:63 stop:1616 length:1554 start_codon:yes stop_codon:yes gene_type:complete